MELRKLFLTTGVILLVIFGSQLSMGVATPVGCEVKKEYRGEIEDYKGKETQRDIYFSFDVNLPGLFNFSSFLIYSLISNIGFSFFHSTVFAEKISNRSPPFISLMSTV